MPNVIGFTLDQLSALEAAMATGAMEVQYGDKTVRYQSLKDMMLLRNTMRNELGLNTQQSGRKLAQHSKGLYPSTDTPPGYDVYSPNF